LSNFNLNSLPNPNTAEAKLALSLYREAISLNDRTYGVLNLFRVMNLKQRNSRDIKKWIKDKIHDINDHYANERIKELQGDGIVDIPEYLYSSCRCAVAHADIKDVTVNPDSIEDRIRLSKDFVLLQKLTEKYIEDVYGIKSRSTIYREHEYNLFGFKVILGEEALEKMLKGEKIDLRSLPKKLSVRLKDRERLNSFEEMDAIFHCERAGVINVEMTSKTSHLKLFMVLDFNNNELIVNEKLTVLKQEKTLIGITVAIDCNKFFKVWNLNGIFEVWDSENDTCLGYLNPFVPVNIDLGSLVKAYDQKIEQLEDLLKQLSIS